MNQHATNKPVPHDTEAECSILGAMLRDESLIPDVRRVLRPEHFFTPENRIICEVLFALADGGNACLAAVKHELQATGQLAKVGRGPTDEEGDAYLRELAEEWSGFSYSLDYDIKTIRDAFAQRELVSMAARMAQDAKSTPAHGAEGLIDKYQQELFNLDLRADTGSDVVMVGEAVAEAIEHADKVHAGEVSPGLSTGFSVIDRATGGMQAGDLWTLAGATSVGKTALAGAFVINAAQAGGGVLCVSAEMDNRAVANRFLQAYSGVEGSRLRCGNLDEDELEARSAAAADIEKWQFAIQTGAVTVGEITIRVRQLAKRWSKPLDLIVVDYLQLMKPGGGDTRAQEVSAIAWGLKGLAMQTGTPILMLSQLSREGVKHETPPSLYALKESGDIENHSNVVLLLHKPVREQIDTDGVPILWLKIAKARDGMTTAWKDADGRPGIALRYKPGITRFEPSTL